MKKIELSEWTKKEHLRYWKNREGDQKIQDLKVKYENSGNNDYSDFLEFLYDHSSEILVGEPLVLSGIKEQISQKFSVIYNSLKQKPVDQSEKIKSFQEQLEEIFDYEHFIGKRKKVWCAYLFLQSINVTICPYCERSFINTFVSEEGSTRAHLDHFYDKKRYPYFSISIYNLIPSCYICNSSFKGSKNFEIDTHFHPYLNSLKDVGYFSFTDENMITEILNLTYTINIKEKDGISDTDKMKIANLKRTFHIEELYELHKNYFDNFISNHRYYTNEYKKELEQTLAVSMNNTNLVDEIIKKQHEDINKQHGLFIQSDTLFSHVLDDLLEILKINHEDNN